MDKNTALKISKNYLQKVRNNHIDFSQAWMFGSFARGNNNENSDIDIAIVLSDNSKSFDVEVKLMTLRSGEETIIEPHAFNIDDFEANNPIVFQILKSGLKIEA